MWSLSVAIRESAVLSKTTTQSAAWASQAFRRKSVNVGNIFCVYKGDKACHHTKNLQGFNFWPQPASLPNFTVQRTWVSLFRVSKELYGCTTTSLTWVQHIVSNKCRLRWFQVGTIFTEFVIFKNVTYHSVSTTILCLIWKHTVCLHQLLGKPEFWNPILNIKRFSSTGKDWNLQSLH